MVSDAYDPNYLRGGDRRIMVIGHPKTPSKINES
jgi:hypothetical protein